MLEFLVAHENIPFLCALGITLALLALEILGLALGAGLSEVLEGILPESCDLECFSGPADTSVGAVLSWLRVDKVPLLILLLIFLGAFSLSGFLAQGAAQALLGSRLPMLWATLLAINGALWSVRLCAPVVSRLMPKDESSAVSSAEFVGKLAVITCGTASAGKPAEARLYDNFGQAHYVMLEPDQADQSFTTGTEVLVVEHCGAIFKAMPKPAPFFAGNG